MSSLIIPERYRERHEQGLQRYLTTGEGPVLGQILEVEALRRDGEELPVELAISQAWREGRSTTFIAFIRDTTERRRDEETEQRRLGATSLLLDTARRLSASLDVDVVMGEVARAAAEASHRGSSSRWAMSFVIEDGAVVEAAGGDHDAHRSQIVLRPEGLPRVEEAIATGVATSVAVTDLPAPLRERAGGRDLVAAAWVPIARGPELLGLLAVGTSDPGDLDPEELLLLDGIAHLAGLALGNAERYCLVRDQGERMALLEQTKSRFLRIASHDLRSPLTVLLGYLSLISEGGFGPVSPELAEAIAVLETKVNEMTAMVGAMFDTALLEDDRLELRLEVTDLRVLAHRAVQRAGPLLAGGQRVSMHAPPEVVGVRVDADRFGSILANLLSNAVKYSPAGE